MPDILTEAQLDEALGRGGQPGQIAMANLFYTMFAALAYPDQPAPTAKTADATLTVAELLTRIVTVTSASAVALTLPTGTLTDAGLLAGSPSRRPRPRLVGHQPRLLIRCRHHDGRSWSHPSRQRCRSNPAPAPGSAPARPPSTPSSRIGSGR